MKYRIKEDYYLEVMERFGKLKQKYPDCKVSVQIVSREYSEGEPTGYIWVCVVGNAMIADWQLLCHLEHTDRGNLVKPYVEVPDGVLNSWYHTPPKCDHCAKNRKRVHTYLIKNLRTGNVKQIGEGCLDKYTCGNSVAMARAVEKFLGLFESNNMEGLYGTKSVVPSFFVKDGIASAICGFSHVQNGAFEKLTAEQVDFYNGLMRWADSLDDSTVNHNRRVMVNAMYLREPKYRELYKVVLDYKWVREEPERERRRLEAQRVAEENRRLTEERDWTSYRGRAVEIISRAIQRAKGRVGQPMHRVDSKALGAIGNKISVDICEMALVYIGQSQYGYYGIVMMTDVKGNKLRWITKESNYRNFGFESKGQVIKLGYTFEATVKQIDNRNGVVITEINYCRYKRNARLDGVTVSYDEEQVIDSGLMRTSISSAENLLARVRGMDYRAFKEFIDSGFVCSKTWGYTYGQLIDVEIVALKVWKETRIGNIRVRRYLAKDRSGNMYSFKGDYRSIGEEILESTGMVVLEPMWTELCGTFRLKGRANEVHEIGVMVFDSSDKRDVAALTVNDEVFGIEVGGSFKRLSLDL